jgi:hypothetical protein
MGVRRCSDSASVTCAGESREESTLAKAVAVCAGYGAEERYFHIGDGALRQADDDLVLLSVCPISVLDREAWLNSAISQVGRNVDLDAIFLRIDLSICEQVLQIYHVVDLHYPLDHFRLSLRGHPAQKISLEEITDAFATYIQECGFAVIKTGYNGLSKNREALVPRLCRIIKNRLEIRCIRQSKPGHTSLCSAHNQISAIW